METIDSAIRFLRNSDSSEAHAMAECIEDGIADLYGQDRYNMALAMADQIAEWAVAFKKQLTSGAQPATAAPTEGTRRIYLLTTVETHRKYTLDVTPDMTFDQIQTKAYDNVDYEVESEETLEVEVHDESGVNITDTLPGSAQ